jgi:hypothetical protein
VIRDVRHAASNASPASAGLFLCAEHLAPVTRQVGIWISNTADEIVAERQQIERKITCGVVIVWPLI